jgi:hypothetical protein
MKEFTGVSEDMGFVFTNTKTGEKRTYQDFNERLCMRGDLVFEFTNQETGEVRRYEERNLMVTTGKNWIADQLSDQAKAAMSHMEIGTGTTAAVVGDTTLETALDRNALDSTTLSTNQVTYAATWAAGDGTGALTEAGIFNSSSGGDMLCRSVFAVKNKGALDALTITWTLTIN